MSSRTSVLSLVRIVFLTTVVLGSTTALEATTPPAPGEKFPQSYLEYLEQHFLIVPKDSVQARIMLQPLKDELHQLSTLRLSDKHQALLQWARTVSLLHQMKCP